MHITSKARRAISNIDSFLCRSDYPDSKKISYETTKSSLRYHRSILEGLLSKGSRKENFKGSHYFYCTDVNNPNCLCSIDNAKINEHVQDVQRLLRGM